MASDDFDIVIEAMLEAPYQSQEKENLVLPALVNWGRA